VASTDGVQLALYDYGGDGPALLLAHATGFHGRVWGPLAARLPDFHVYALDFRGHGDSVIPPGLTFEWEGFGDDVLAVVDALSATAGSGVTGHGLLAAGHCKGGASLLLAEEERPGTFASLYVYEPVVFPGEPEGRPTENPLAAGALKRREVFESYEAACENFASKPPLEVLPPDVLRAYVEHGFAAQPDGTVQLKCLPASESAVYTMGARHSAWAHLDEVTCPVTVAMGEDAPFSPASFAPAIVGRLPHGRLEQHPDLGHFGPLQAPDVIASAIRAALTAG
jgi:pimeloyl-ACP methyl ester carboxylesterase